jgi:hypothetical protein
VQCPFSSQNGAPAQGRLTFILRLRAEPHLADPIRNLRMLLKAALRRFGFRCVEISEAREGQS